MLNIINKIVNELNLKFENILLVTNDNDNDNMSDVISDIKNSKGIFISNIYNNMEDFESELNENTDLSDEEVYTHRQLFISELKLMTRIFISKFFSNNMFHMETKCEKVTSITDSLSIINNVNDSRLNCKEMSSYIISSKVRDLVTDCDECGSSINSSIVTEYASYINLGIDIESVIGSVLNCKNYIDFINGVTNYVLNCVELTFLISLNIILYSLMDLISNYDEFDYFINSNVKLKQIMPFFNTNLTHFTLFIDTNFTHCTTFIDTNFTYSTPFVNTKLKDPLSFFI